MKSIKIIIKIFFFLSFFIMGQYLIRCAILNDKDAYGRMLLGNIYQNENNIDVLVCGASHCQLGVNTTLMKEDFGQGVINAGTSAQGLETTLALIKEAASYHDLKTVFVDLDYSIVMREDPNLESIYMVSDYFKPSFRKVEYLLNATPFEFYLNSFLPLHIGREYTKDINVIRQNLKSRLDKSYNHIDDKYLFRKWDTDFEPSVSELEGILWSTFAGEEISTKIPDIQQKNLKNIIKFCEGKGIQLEFFCTPSSPLFMNRIENYDEYLRVLKEFLQPLGKECYDFNLCKETALLFDYNKHFKDDNHLSGEGATLFTEVLCDFYSGRIDEKDLFYETYDEKLENSSLSFLGYYVERRESGVEFIPVTTGEGLELTTATEFKDGIYYVDTTINGNSLNTLQLKDEKIP